MGFTKYSNGNACIAIINRGRSVERFIKGDIVFIPFPYSDLTNTKRRLALVLPAQASLLEYHVPGGELPSN